MAKVSTSYKKGQSGNPKGRPKKGWTWSEALEDAMKEAMKDGKPVKHHVARALVREALKGNVQAAKEIMNRMDGMPKQAIETDGTLEVIVKRHE